MSDTTTATESGGILNGFKEFIARGNAVDLAVGVVIGAAFGAVIDSIVDWVLNPLIGAIFGQPDLTRIWTLNIGWPGQTPATILPGAVATALINFLLVAAAIYFFVVLPLNKLAARRSKPVQEEGPAADLVLLTEIRDLLAANGAKGGTTTPGV